MKKIALLGLFALLLTTMVPANAQSFSLAQNFSVAFPKKGTVALPVTTAVGFAFPIIATTYFGWFNEVGVATAFDAFHPAPRLITGPMLIAGRWNIAATVMYQFLPGYSDTTAKVLVAGSMVFTMHTSKAIAVALIVGGGQLVGGAPSVVVAPKIIFKF